MLLFQSEASPIGMVTSNQASLIVSLLCIGGVLGTLIFGILSDVWGRKAMLLLLTIPQFVANVLILVGTNINCIYGARFLFGLSGGGAFLLIPIFISEISHER